MAAGDVVVTAVVALRPSADRFTVRIPAEDLRGLRGADRARAIEGLVELEATNHVEVTIIDTQEAR